jgi:flagellar basal-body rod protein FlgF
MDRLLYVAMTGASQSLEQQAQIANNLANASTTGFRAQLNAYRAVPLRTPDQLAAGTTDVTRTYVVNSTPVADFTPGPVQQTGNPLDVALGGAGWFTVQTPDGNEAYTRAGNFQVNAAGQLVTASGLPVVGNAGPIAIPQGADVTISNDGTISALTPGDPPNTVAAVDQLKLVNPDPQTAPMVRGDDGLFRQADGTPAEADPTVQVTPGAVEGSNVNPINSMVAMISNARQFDMQMKLLQTADTDDQTANQLLTFTS